MLGKSYYIARPSSKLDIATFCILGCPSGGTSMVSGLLRQFGIPMSDGNMEDASNEDRDFVGHNGIRDIFYAPQKWTECCEYLLKITSVIGGRNRKFSRWGWKDPFSIYYIEYVQKMLRNPHYIVVTRDPSPIGFRNYLDFPNQNPCLPNIELAAQTYARIISFISKSPAPSIVLSYEKALQHPNEVVSALSSFCGATGFDTAQLAAYIAPGKIDARWD